MKKRKKSRVCWVEKWTLNKNMLLVNGIIDLISPQLYIRKGQCVNPKKVRITIEEL